MATKNEQQASAAAIAELRAAAEQGDAGAAIELYNAQKKNGRGNSDYKWDPRTPTVVDSQGVQYGVVAWFPEGATEKTYFVLEFNTHNRSAKLIHTAAGAALTIDRPSAMKDVISALQMTGHIK